MPAKPIPDNYPILTPYLFVKDAAAAIEFYRLAFGARERMRLPCPDGKVGHAELEIGGGSPVTLHLYVQDVDECCRRAVAAGATLIRPVQDQFYGDRSGQLRDPFGHLWSVASQIEEISLQELEKRAATMYGSE